MSQIIRVEKNKNYTVMGNWHLRDNTLSLKAKGFLSLVLSLPEDWAYSKQGLKSLIREGETVLDTVLKELKRAGYLEVNKLTSDKTRSGRFEYEYVFYERAQEKKTLGDGSPDIETPDPENLGLENHPLYKYTNIQNTEELNKDNKKNVSFEEEFEELWKLYPNKKGKAKALKAYMRARKSGVDMKQIRDGIEAYSNQIKAEGTPKQYQKHGSTWFNGKCWEDEYDSLKPETPSGVNQSGEGVAAADWADAF